MTSRATMPVLVLALSACGHYSFESAVTRSDGGDANDGAGDAADARVEQGLLVWLDCDHFVGNVLTGAPGNPTLASCDNNLCPTIVSGGPRGNACLFDGLDDVVTVAPSSGFQPVMFSIAVWLREEMIPGLYTAAWVKHSSDISQETWGVYDFTNGGTTTLIAGGGATGEAYTNLGAPILGVWTHVAVTFDGSDYAAFRNGILVGSATATLPIGDAMNELVLGAEFIASNRSSFWFGALDDARLYDRVLSLAEITALATP